MKVNSHRIYIDNLLLLLRNVTNNRQLVAFESLEISKCKNSMNSDKGPIPNSPQLEFRVTWLCSVNHDIR